jgi:hypothetical protein
MRKHNDKLLIRKPEATNPSWSTRFNKALNHTDNFFNNISDLQESLGSTPPQRICNTDQTALSTVHNPFKIVKLRNDQIRNATLSHHQLATVLQQ